MRMFFLFISILLWQSVSAQTVFNFNSIQVVEHKDELDQKFSTYQVYEAEAQELFDALKKNSESNELIFRFEKEGRWNMSLHEQHLIQDQYVVKTTSDGVKKGITPNDILTYNGNYQDANQGQIALTITSDLIYGFVEKNGETFFIEPLVYLINDSNKAQFVVYNEKDVLHTAGTCAAHDKSNKEAELNSMIDNLGQEKMNCYFLEMAIASDFSMFQKYGSVGGVEAHTLGVLNNAQTNYDNEFNNEILFDVVTQFVVDCAGCDPWPSGNDASALLSSFRQWGNSGNFGVSYDLGQLWTDRNISSNGDNSTVGVAYVGGLCNSFKYQLIEDFSSTAWALRVVVSHETGHNFGQGHDAGGSGFIMAPSVNNTNTWSPSSISGINSTINAEISSGCFAPCVIVDPPIAAFDVSQQSGCVPLTVNFTDLSQNVPDTWQWDFSGGTPTSSTDQNPTVTYAAAGSYDVTLTVSNSAGVDTEVSLGYINVFDNPTADFTYSISERTLILINNSVGDDWLWDFGDGNSSVEQNPIHTYLEDGVYQVTLISSNGCGSVPFTANVTISTLPSAGFTSDLTVGCEPLTVVYSDQSSNNAVDRLWTFPGGNPNTSNAEFPVVVYANPGTYDVTLEVTNAAGSNTLTQTDYISVSPLPVAGFSFSTTDLTVDFTNSSTDALTYLWDFGDSNSSSDIDPTHTYNTGGTFNVILTAFSDCDTVTSSQMLTLSAIPTTGINADITEGCATLTVNYSDLSTNNPTTWNWSFPGGSPSSSTDQNPQVNYANQGIYSVELIASNAAGADTINLADYIDVNDIPVADFNFSTSNTSATFSNTSSNAVSYDWDFGDGNNSNESSPTHDFGEDGIYVVTLTATNACGSSSETINVEIANAPTAGATSNITSGCADLTVQFSDQSSINATAWSWTFTGGNPSSSSLQNPTVVYDTEGTFDVELVVSNSTGSDQIILTNYISIDDIPDAAFSVSITDMVADFTNATNNANSYSWDFGDGNSSNNSDPSHTYNSDGAYTVVLTATNDCGDEMVSQIVNISNAPTAGATSNITSGCAPLEVDFTDLSSSNSTSWNWTFEGGTPSTSNDQNPTIVYNDQGSFDVTLEVSNAAGSNTVVLEDYISVQVGPSADFSTTITELEVQFDNNSDNGNSYSWDFGDGNSSVSENPNHSYATDGSYVVTLTTINDCGTETHTENITVVSMPTAGFSVETSSGCVPFTVQFTDLSSSNTTEWLWTFEGGNPSSSTAANPVVVYENAGSFDVTLEVSNTAGSNTSNMMDVIEVGDIPNAMFTNTIEALEVSFQNQSTDGLTYQWDFGDGNTSADQNPSHTYSMEAIFTVTLTVTNDCGSDIFTQLINLTQAPLSSFGYSFSEGCAGLEVQFTDNSSGTVTNWNWTFPGGNPATSNLQNPVVTYNTPGSYDVSLEVSSSAGTNSSTETNIINIIPEPSAGFNYSNTGFDFDFMNTSTNGNSYSWDFGDGNLSALENPAHSYLMAGTYEVVLIVTNACGTSQLSETILIETAPVGAFSASQVNGCLPFVVDLIDESSNNVTSWNWSFPGGSPSSSTDQNPTVTYDESGVYSVTLEVANSAGTFTVTRLDYIEVQEAPIADFSSITMDNSVSLTNQSTGAISYVWDFGDGNTSMEQDPTHVYGANGTYDITLTVTNDCGTSTQSTSVIIDNLTLPSAQFSSNIESGCAPLEVLFTDASSDNTLTWSWVFEGGMPATSTEQNPQVTYATPGVYDVQLTVGNAEGEDVVNQQDLIVVNDIPSALFGFAAAELSVDFDADENDATNYVWEFGDGNSGSGEMSTHVYALGGTYEVSLTVTNDCGTFTSARSVTVAEGISAPMAEFTSDVEQGCAPVTISYSDLSENNPTSWFWEFEGGTPGSSTEQNPSVVYNSAGNFNVQLTASNAAGENVLIKNDLVSIGESPTANYEYSIGADQVVNFEDLSSSATSWSWDFGDNLGTSTEQNPSYNYAASGTYTVTLVVSNFCGENTYTQQVTAGSTASIDLNELINIQIFPNPTSSEFHLIVNGSYHSEIELLVYNSIGQLQLNDQFYQAGQTTKSYDLDNVASGTYFVELRSTDGSVFSKLVVTPK